MHPITVRQGQNFNIVGRVEDVMGFIWTERYCSYGDFQLTTKTPIPGLGLYAPLRQHSASSPTWLTYGASNRVMMVEYHEEQPDGTYLTKGKSVENFFKWRPVFNRPRVWKLNLRYLDAWPRDIMNALVRDFAITPLDLGISNSGGTHMNLSPLPNLTWSGVGQIASEPKMSYYVDGHNDLYRVLTDLARDNKFGWRIVSSDPQLAIPLHFQAYRGIMRDSVIFSEALGNFKNAKRVESIENAANVIYGIGGTTRVKVGSEYQQQDAGWNIATGPGEFYGDTGWNRRIVAVDMTERDGVDLTVAPLPDYASARKLQKILREEYPEIKRWDGEVGYDIGYAYGTDYNLGDAVKVHGRQQGSSEDMYVTEYTWSHGESGYREFPTLSAELY
jgi:hypothetical protein